MEVLQRRVLRCLDLSSQIPTVESDRRCSSPGYSTVLSLAKKRHREKADMVFDMVFDIDIRAG
jgi:hypothetical protein